MSYVRRTAFFHLLLFQATWKVSLGKLLILMDQTRERVCYLISKHREIKKTSKNQGKKTTTFWAFAVFSYKNTWFWDEINGNFRKWFQKQRHEVLCKLCIVMFEVKQLGISGLKIICSVITIEKKVVNWHNDIYLQSYSQALVRSDVLLSRKKGSNQFLQPRIVLLL